MPAAAAPQSTEINIDDPKKAAMIDALEKTLGVVTAAAKKVGIHRTTHYLWVRTDPAYAEAVEQCGNAALDFAESELFKQIKSGQVGATIFYLKTKGKHRGYVERQEFTGKDGAELNLQVKVVKTAAPVMSEDDIVDDIQP